MSFEGLRLLVVAERLERLHVVGPAAAHAHPDFEINALAEHLSNIGSREARNFAQLRAALADHNRLVAFALNDERCNDGRLLIGLRPFVNRDGNAIRQFVAEQAKGLFANRFSRKEAGRLVGEEIRIEIRNALRKKLFDFAEKLRAIGMQVKLDTNGMRPEVVKEGVERGLFDYVAMDVKAPFEKYYKVSPTRTADAAKLRETAAYLKTTASTSASVERTERFMRRVSCVFTFV